MREHYKFWMETSKPSCNCYFLFIWPVMMSSAFTVTVCVGGQHFGHNIPKINNSTHSLHIYLKAGIAQLVFL